MVTIAPDTQTSELRGRDGAGDRLRIAVAGATGYVGSHLVPRLAAAGHGVVAMSRSTQDPHVEGVVHRAVDIGDRAGLTAALAGIDAAYYLVHSMAGGDDFAERDRSLAANFAAAAADAGVGRIVYLGGLGDDESDSAHLRSRHQVGNELAAGSVPVVELRAAVVLGSGSISFEMLRYLTERLPFMVCPRWIRTRIQPIAERDLLAHLERGLSDDIAPGIYEVGGPDVTTYRDMIATYAKVRGLRPRRIVDVPLLTPGLSARWVDLVTPVDTAVSHALVESLVTEVVVTDGLRTSAAFGLEPGDSAGVAEAISTALASQEATVPDRLFDLPTGTHEGIYAMQEHARLHTSDLAAVRHGLRSCGGDLSWYGLSWAWRLRIALGRPFGERLTLHRPDDLEPGARVDWWEAARVDDNTLVLATDRWFCGEAWLGYRLESGPDDPDQAHLVQVGALRSKGLLGVVYWRLLWPIHLVVFELMAKRQAKVKKAASNGRLAELRVRLDRRHAPSGSRSAGRPLQP